MARARTCAPPRNRPSHVSHFFVALQVISASVSDASCAQLLQPLQLAGRRAFPGRGSLDLHLDPGTPMYRVALYSVPVWV